MVDIHEVPKTLDEHPVEPLEVRVRRVQEQHLVRDDRDGEQQGRSDGRAQR